MMGTYKLTSADLAGAVARWAQAEGYTSYQLGTDTQPDGQILVGAKACKRADDAPAWRKMQMVEPQSGGRDAKI